MTQVDVHTSLYSLLQEMQEIKRDEMTNFSRSKMSQKWLIATDQNKSKLKYSICNITGLVKINVSFVKEGFKTY